MCVWLSVSVSACLVLLNTLFQDDTHTAHIGKGSLPITLLLGEGCVQPELCSTSPVAGACQLHRCCKLDPIFL